MATVLDADQVVVPASGSVSLAFGPGPAFHKWIVSRVSVAVSGSSDEPSCDLFLDSTSGYRLASTDAGAADDADFPEGIVLMPGQRIVPLFAGATPGAVATVTVWGSSGPV